MVSANIMLKKKRNKTHTKNPFFTFSAFSMNCRQQLPISWIYNDALNPFLLSHSLPGFTVHIANVLLTQSLWNPHAIFFLTNIILYYDLIKSLIPSSIFYFYCELFFFLIEILNSVDVMHSCQIVTMAESAKRTAFPMGLWFLLLFNSY